MAFTISTKVTEYVLEADRALPEEFKTIWHITPRSNKTANEIFASYAKSSEQKGGVTKTHVDKLTDADVLSFLKTVSKVENLLIDEASDEQFTKGLLELDGVVAVEWDGKKGKRIPMIDTRPALTAIVGILSAADLLEISEAGNKSTLLSEGDRRNL